MMVGRIRFSRVIGLLAALILFVGCDRGPKCYPVKGQVTWQGEPVPLGEVTFFPVGGGRPATGNITGDGTYELTTHERGDGALVGEYKVSIECIEYPKSNQPLPKTLAEEAQVDISHRTTPQRLIPEIFSSPDASKLTATIDAESNTIDFHLPPQ